MNEARIRISYRWNSIAIIIITFKSLLFWTVCIVTCCSVISYWSRGMERWHCSAAR